MVFRDYFKRYTGGKSFEVSAGGSNDNSHGTNNTISGDFSSNSSSYLAR